MCRCDAFFTKCRQIKIDIQNSFRNSTVFTNCVFERKNWRWNGSINWFKCVRCVPISSPSTKKSAWKFKCKRNGTQISISKIECKIELFYLRVNKKYTVLCMWACSLTLSLSRLLVSGHFNSISIQPSNHLFEPLSSE